MLVCAFPRAFCAVCLEFVFFPAVHHVPPCWNYWWVSRGKRTSNTRNLLIYWPLMQTVACFILLYPLLIFWYNPSMITLRCCLTEVSLKCHYSDGNHWSLSLSLCTDCLCPVWMEVETSPHHRCQCCCVSCGGGKTHTLIYTHMVTVDVFLMFSFCFFMQCAHLSHIAGLILCCEKKCFKVRMLLSSKRQTVVSVIVNTWSMWLFLTLFWWTVCICKAFEIPQSSIRLSCLILG